MSKELETTEQIWKLLNARLKSFFLKRVSDEQVAEDLLQETFVRIHKKLDTIEDQQRIVAWVFQIARNLVVDHYRSKAKSAHAVERESFEGAANEEENINELVIGWLPKMIAKLPDKYREAVELYELKGVSQQEIANHLGISLSGAKSRVQRGRKKLKSLLFDCCSFELDKRGNLIDYKQNSEESCVECNNECK